MALTPDFQARKDAILKRNKPVSLDLCMSHEAPATMKDALGHTWCSACQIRYELAQWGYAHHYPEIYVDPYAIAEGEEMWKIIAVVGRTEAIESIMEGLRRVPEIDEVAS